MPINYILLFIFTICTSYIVAGFCSYFPAICVLAAAVTSATVALGLTVVAFTIKDEIVGYLWGLLAAYAFSLIPIILFASLVRQYFIFMIIQGLMIPLVSLYIIFDTRMIVANYGTEDYIIAAVVLYADLMMLFVYILSIFGSSN